MSHEPKHECAGYLMLREKEDWQEESVHRAACHCEAILEIEGKHYCLMHAPTKYKSDDFEKAFQEKLAAKNYNFCGVWFPGDANFSKHNFESEVNFNFAVFNGHADFRAAQFSGGDADFREVQFTGGDTDFSNAQFSGADANFSNTRFSGGSTYFRGVQFGGADVIFKNTEFRGKNTIFSRTEFSKAVGFIDAVFTNRISFLQAIFKQRVLFNRVRFCAGSMVTFSLARFGDFTGFREFKIEKGVDFYFGGATSENPEHIHFHSIDNLQPRWFINIDPRKFNFENTAFPLLKRKTLRDFFRQCRNFAPKKSFLALRRRPKLAAEILKLKATSEIEIETTVNYLRLFSRNRNVIGNPPYQLLITAYRRLAENAEENARYEEAMSLRYMAMDFHRHSTWWGRFFPITLHWWYWASSGYGERAFRALIMLFLIWLIPFGLYASSLGMFERKMTAADVRLLTGDAAPHLSDEKIEKYISNTELYDLPAFSAKTNADLRDAAFYSLNVMAFQKPEPKPANDSWLTRLVVTLQTILGPLQAALLALAIRRKFMR
jgi:hypothetical protein